MAPSATPIEPLHNLSDRTKSSKKVGLELTGSLEKFAWDDVTPVIGREFAEANIVDDILNQPNADQLLRDLAITSRFYIDEEMVRSNDLQTSKRTCSSAGTGKFGSLQYVSASTNRRQLTGKPSTSTLHIHPILNDSRELGGSDPEISTISSEQRKKLFTSEIGKKQYDSAQWHSDIQFEKVPADYTSLRLVQLPKSGGDTVWASGYEIYDRISPLYQKFLETLTASFGGEGFRKLAESSVADLYVKPRGSPENIGGDVVADHPVVRTNPVSGWKSIFSVGSFPTQINGLAQEESNRLLKWFKDILVTNHDLQVRFKWKSPNDIAIWDNRSAFHTATYDYEGLGERFGNRTVGIGERPYFDPNSQSRRQALAAAEAESAA